MRDVAVEIARTGAERGQGLNALREYVQSRVLGALQESGTFVHWAFMGGTALRFLYRIPRFSEDLGFTCEKPAAAPPFERALSDVTRVLEREGYAVRVKVNDSGAVYRAMLGFVGLVFEAGISAHTEEILWVRVEVDTNPPAGAVLSVTLVDRFGPLRFQHHDLPSLFAGKTAAVLAREYTKGRDLYDLMWFLMRPVPLEPNLALLRNALDQTAPGIAASASEDWRGALRNRLAAVDWADARRDVEPFLELRRDLELISAETFAELLGA